MTDGATRRLRELRIATEQQLVAFEEASGSERANALHRLLLSLQLRWKLEEQVVLPALGRVTDRQLLPPVEKESILFEEMATLARTAALAIKAQRTIAATLAGLSALRSERIEAAVRRAGPRVGFDDGALRREIDAMLKRWHREVRATGDIENEEIDPVGLPPR